MTDTAIFNSPQTLTHIRYPAYKDSGVDGLGEIPANWEMRKLKYVLTERNDRSDTSLEKIFMVSQEHGLVIRADYHEKAIAGQTSIGSKRVFYNDLVFNKLKAHWGGWVLADSLLLVLRNMFRLKLNRTAIVRWSCKSGHETYF